MTLLIIYHVTNLMCTLQERMKELLPTDPTTTSSIAEGTVWWAPNDAYSQAIGNKPEHASQVRQVGPNILPVHGSIHSYYKPVQPRSQNPGSAGISQMIKAVLQAEREKHRAEIDALLAAQREQTVAQQAEKEKHRAEIDALLVTQQQQIFKKKANTNLMYEAHFHHLESMMHSRSTSELTRVKDVPDKESPTHLVVRSSVGSGSGNAFFFFRFLQYMSYTLKLVFIYIYCNSCYNLLYLGWFGDTFDCF